MEKKLILEKTQFCYFVQCEGLQFSRNVSKNFNNESVVFILLDTMYIVYNLQF